MLNNLQAADCGCGSGPNCQTKQKIMSYCLYYTTVIVVSLLSCIAINSPLFNWGRIGKSLVFSFSFFLTPEFNAKVSDYLSPSYKKLTNYIYEFLNKDSYAPITKDELLVKQVEVKEKVKKFVTDDSKQQIIYSSDEGSKIWAKNGPHFITAGKDVDLFYFSLCSTKIIDKKVTVISGFDVTKDKISFFCTKKELKYDDVKIIESLNNTCIEVQGNDHVSPICFAERLDINLEDINLTTLGHVKTELGIEG